MDKLNSTVSYVYDELEQQNVVFRIELAHNFEDIVAVHDEILYK